MIRSPPGYFFIIPLAIVLLVSTVSAIAPPVADFTANETSICLGNEIAFTDLSTFDPESWEWNFGDGNSSTEQHPNYIYGYTGTFTVTLTATNAGGSDDMEKKAYITVTDCAGNPDFSADATCQIGKPMTVQFTGYCPYPEFKNHWDFGDGDDIDDIQSPEHTYLEYGTYNVSHLCWHTPYPMAFENKTDYITVGTNGTVCAEDCGACTRDPDGEEYPNYLLIGATIGLLFGMVIFRRNEMI